MFITHQHYRERVPHPEVLNLLYLFYVAYTGTIISVLMHRIPLKSEIKCVRSVKFVISNLRSLYKYHYTSTNAVDPIKILKLSKSSIKMGDPRKSFYILRPPFKRKKEKQSLRSLYEGVHNPYILSSLEAYIIYRSYLHIP